MAELIFIQKNHKKKLVRFVILKKNNFYLDFFVLKKGWSQHTRFTITIHYHRPNILHLSCTLAICHLDWLHCIQESSSNYRDCYNSFNLGHKIKNNFSSCLSINKNNFLTFIFNYIWTNHRNKNVTFKKIIISPLLYWKIIIMQYFSTNYNWSRSQL